MAHPEKLAHWAQERDVIVIVDEAHHAVATTYQQVIHQVRKAARNMQLLGLTATPFRTDEEESGALKKLFTHDILFKRDLKTLILAGMLAFSYLLPDDEVQVEILVYDNLKEGFHQMRKELPVVCATCHCT